MAYSISKSGRLSCVLVAMSGIALAVFGVGIAVVVWVLQSDEPRRDATEDEVRAAAAKCGAVISRMHHRKNENEGRQSNRELGIPNIGVTIEIKSDADFSAKANCIDRELWALYAYSSIGGPNGEDLLVSSGVDHIM